MKSKTEIAAKSGGWTETIWRKTTRTFPLFFTLATFAILALDIMGFFTYYTAFLAMLTVGWGACVSSGAMLFNYRKMRMNSDSPDEVQPFTKWRIMLSIMIFFGFLQVILAFMVLLLNSSTL